MCRPLPSVSETDTSQYPSIEARKWCEGFVVQEQVWGAERAAPMFVGCAVEGKLWRLMQGLSIKCLSSVNATAKLWGTHPWYAESDSALSVVCYAPHLRNAWSHVCGLAARWNATGLEVVWKALNRAVTGQESL